MKRFLCFAAAAVLALGLGGCGGKGSKAIRLDMTGPIYNLDPQFATDPYARMIISNCFEGLVRQEADGTMVPAAAEDFTLSADGLTYTFTLREDTRWGGGDREPIPVTAYDFQFAFRRLFDPETPSPYSGEYLMIRGGAEALAGEIPVEGIGVEALDGRTLRITLTQAAPFFLQRLAATPAMPCNPEFFEETRARYGLETQYMIFNGPYQVGVWDNEGYISLEASASYWNAGRLNCPRVLLYCSRLQQDDGTLLTPRELFLEGDSEVARVEYGDLEALLRDGAAYISFDDSVWVLAFNQRSGALSSAAVRQALAGVLERSELDQRVSEQFTLSNSLVPAGAKVFDKTYQELAGQPELLSLGSQEARQLLAQGLEEAGYASLPTLTLMLPQSADMGSLGGYFQKLWQQGLNQYVNLNILEDSGFQSALRSGQGWDMAILPVQVENQDPAGALTAFETGSPANYTGFGDPEFDRLLGEAQMASQLDEAVELYRQAEQFLIDQGVAVPLYTQSAYYAVAGDVTGLEIRSGGMMDFRMAWRK